MRPVAHRIWPAFRRELRTRDAAWHAPDPTRLRSADEYARVYTTRPDGFAPAPALKAGAYRQLAREGLWGDCRRLHELGCGTGDNLLAIRRACPQLLLSGSDFNLAQLRALQRDPRFQGLSFAAVDLEGDLAALPPADAYLLWGVEFALSDDALRRLSARIAGRRLDLWSNHVATAHMALGRVKDQIRPQPGRLIGWYRSVRALERLFGQHRLTRVAPRYGGSTFTLLRFAPRSPR